MTKPIIAVIGPNSDKADNNALKIAEQIGKRIIDSGYRIMTGGKDGVMMAAFQGAKKSANYAEGLTIGVIPTYNSDDANPECDIIIATGIGFARNQIIVASADVIVAISGGAGTLSEISFAWQLNKPIVAITSSKGWSSKIGRKLDSKDRDEIYNAKNVEEAIRFIKSIITSGSK